MFKVILRRAFANTVAAVISITYSEWLSVALVIQHAKRIGLVTVSSVTCLAVPYTSSDSLAALDSISVEDFRQCFQHWERCWDCCIQSQGEYFEVE